MLCMVDLKEGPRNRSSGPWILARAQAPTLSRKPSVPLENDYKYREIPFDLRKM
jgi:hypothetical protein